MLFLLDSCSEWGKVTDCGLCRPDTADGGICGGGDFSLL